MGINSYQIKKKFGTNEVLKDITFEIRSGSISVLIGPNGSGKTTWINIALGLYTADFGFVSFDGHKLNQVRDEIAVVFDESPIVNYLNGYDNIEVLCGKQYSQNDFRLVTDALGMDDDFLRKKGKTYSFGQKHRLSVASALLRNPSFFILDEPATGLDLENWDKIMEILKKRAADGCSIMLTGHNYNMIEEVADNVLVLKNGTIYFDGALSEFIGVDDNLKQAYKKVFIKENVQG